MMIPSHFREEAQRTASDTNGALTNRDLMKESALGLEMCLYPSCHINFPSSYNCYKRHQLRFLPEDVHASWF